MIEPTQTNIYCTEYRHHWTGRIMRASDYGYKCWHFIKKK